MSSKKHLLFNLTEYKVTDKEFYGNKIYCGVFMERILFNCYLNWLKKLNSDLFKRLLKLPIPAKILMVLLIGSLIAIIILALFNIKFVIIPFLIEIIVCLSTSLYTDHYGIKNSIQELNNYMDILILLVQKCKRNI